MAARRGPAMPVQPGPLHPIEVSMSKLVSLAALIVAGGAYIALRDSSRRQRLLLEAPRRKPEPVQTWEGEGGAFPTTGSQMGPDPTVTASTDDTGHDVLHRESIPGIQ
jgi:hypothetical protein